MIKPPLHSSIALIGLRFTILRDFTSPLRSMWKKSFKKFLLKFGRIGKLWMKNNFAGYLFITMRNLVFNRSRKNLNEPFYQLSVIEAVEESYDIEEELDAANLRTHISALISMLPPRQQEVFRLSRDEELSYREIAERLQISERTVEHHISDALKFLRKNIKLYLLFLSL